MTLRVDLSKIKDYQSICYNKEDKEQGTALNFFNLPYADATNYLVLGAAAIGMGEITQTITERFLLGINSCRKI